MILKMVASDRFSVEIQKIRTQEVRTNHLVLGVIVVRSAVGHSQPHAAHFLHALLGFHNRQRIDAMLTNQPGQEQL